ncbi:MAG TPA: type I-E CRISPR-associated protein Cse2/CasB [bacterium]|mgnify:CR=1 FL=1|nr:MAG: CRISPR-associated protein Cse2 (CRISPR_cse2) [bacterium ADurb.Bin236]HOY62114.1 type I-E CRISPR-associated protein Cse2/CasB [bacterium]HPI77641.1 type I-E CRISPR-associated protein Cse2/CasB [bacterium]HPN93486.1 type I-E CRISPR-associated protein Cse2/CasB [bacterium]
MSETKRFIDTLTNLKSGELSLLRAHSGQKLDESVPAFDLFTGIWWPLRQRSQRAPRREVAWLIAKLYAFRPAVSNEQGKTLASQLGSSMPRNQTSDESNRLRLIFDNLLLASLSDIEPSLQWALDRIESKKLNLDWVKLTDDLSIWERESTRLRWAEEFLNRKGE